MMTTSEVWRWAIAAHGDQLYGEHPYSYHLNAVAAVAKRFGFISDLIDQACALHDVGEDTDYRQADLLEAGINPRVVSIAAAVWDEPGATRKERKAKTYPKIRAIREALVVKLCDRIANVEQCLLEGNAKLAMYREEYAEFERQLRNPSDQGLEPLWLHLECLLETGAAANLAATCPYGQVDCQSKNGGGICTCAMPTLEAEPDAAT